MNIDQFAQDLQSFSGVVTNLKAAFTPGATPKTAQPTFQQPNSSPKTAGGIDVTKIALGVAALVLVAIVMKRVF